MTTAVGPPAPALLATPGDRVRSCRRRSSTPTSCRRATHDSASMPRGSDVSTIDLSSSTDSRIAVAGQVLAMLQRTARRHAIPLMVIGATARDILSVAIAGAPPDRATADIDIAVAVSSWQAFESLTADLEHVVDVGTRSSSRACTSTSSRSASSRHAGASSTGATGAK